MESTETLKSTLIDCLKQQVCELEVLTSIYPDNGDIIFTKKSILEDIKDFIDNKTEYTPNHLDFTLNLIVENLKLEISINLPSFYPKEEPDIFIRCNHLNRQQETLLNNNLTDYININHCGEQCLYTAISWLQDNVGKYKCTTAEITGPVESKMTNQVQDKFVRLWIFSHHIYNRKKREEIVKIARDYDLNGFCLPGKPGIICVEGSEDSCFNWWKIIKNMNWKKIVIKKTETFDDSVRIKEQKFSNFEEIVFQNSNKKNSDMSAFSKFIDDHGLSHIFNDLFNLS